MIPHKKTLVASHKTTKEKYVWRVYVRMSGKGKRPPTKKPSPQSRSARAKLQFPVGRIHGYLKGKRRPENPLSGLTIVDRVTPKGAVFMAAVLEYLTAEVLKIAGAAAKEKKKARIVPKHIQEAISADEEMCQLLQSTMIGRLEARHTEHIHAALLPCANQKQTKCDVYITEYIGIEPWVTSDWKPLPAGVEPEPTTGQPQPPQHHRLRATKQRQMDVKLRYPFAPVYENAKEEREAIAKELNTNADELTEANIIAYRTREGGSLVITAPEEALIEFFDVNDKSLVIIRGKGDNVPFTVFKETLTWPKDAEAVRINVQGSQQSSQKPPTTKRKRKTKVKLPGKKRLKQTTTIDQREQQLLRLDSILERMPESDYTASTRARIKKLQYDNNDPDIHGSTIQNAIQDIKAGIKKVFYAVKAQRQKEKAARGED